MILGQETSTPLKHGHGESLPDFPSSESPISKVQENMEEMDAHTSFTISEATLERY